MKLNPEALSGLASYIRMVKGYLDVYNENKGGLQGLSAADRGAFDGLYGHAVSFCSFFEGEPPYYACAFGGLPRILNKQVEYAEALKNLLVAVWSTEAARQALYTKLQPTVESPEELKSLMT